MLYYSLMFSISSASPKPSPSGGIRIRGLRSLSVAHAAVKHSGAAPPPCRRGCASALSASADVTLWVLFGISEAVPHGVAVVTASCATLAWRLSMVGQLRRPAAVAALPPCLPLRV